MQKPTSPSESTRENSFSLDYVPLESLLLVSNLIRRPLPQDNKEEAKFYYTIVVPRAAHRTNEITSGICALTVGKQVEAISPIELNATYLFGFKTKDDIADKSEQRRIIEQVIRATVWPRFRDLVALTGNQADLDLPPLPSTPDKVTFGEEKEATAERKK